MEFKDKLRNLRKQKGLTQEALAEHLFVSRTAVSKWESGRGYPGIDSLKAIAAFFSVSVDDLLSGGEVLSIAEDAVREKKRRMGALVFGLLDVGALLLLFLPFFGERTGDAVIAVSLMGLTGVAPYLKAAYFAAVMAMAVTGILTLALQKGYYRFSLLLNIVGVLLFIISLQPYAAVFLFLFLMIKVPVQYK